LFRSGSPQPLFILETHFAGDEAVQTVELGRKPALGSVEFLELSDRSPFPVAVAVHTRAADGVESTYVIYNAGGKIRRLRLRETDQERFQLLDLDGSGVTDIVVTRRLPEAGSGIETFVELLTFDGDDYRTDASFGLVRELRIFLGDSRNLMLAGEWGELVRSVVDLRTQIDSETETPDRQTIDPPPADLLALAFTAAEDEGETGASDEPRVVAPPDEPADEPVPIEFDYARTTTPISAVVFPHIAENPFPYPFLGTSFSVTFRVECCGGFPRFFDAVVQLSPNPFEGPRFAFLTQVGTQQ
jgi:hypothetical protein